MSKVDKLLQSYRRHIALPWQSSLAAVQRVIFAVYDKSDELRVRAQTGDFQNATLEAGKRWLLLDVTDAFPRWMNSLESRDAYFEDPQDLVGYPAGEIREFTAWLVADLGEQIRRHADADTVVGILGVATLFGISRVSAVVEGIKDVVPGRMLVFFPGEHQADAHQYRLLDARDGWNYLAVPLTASDQEF